MRRVVTQASEKQTRSHGASGGALAAAAGAHVLKPAASTAGRSETGGLAADDTPRGPQRKQCAHVSASQRQIDSPDSRIEEGILLMSLNDEEVVALVLVLEVCLHVGVGVGGYALSNQVKQRGTLYSGKWQKLVSKSWSSLSKFIVHDYTTMKHVMSQVFFFF